jgi:hypothetical protein
MKKKTAILFLIFNRTETTKKVFETIRDYKPSKLFIAADGPREGKPGEKERCEEARKITEKIDWPCEVKRLYRDKNLGCKYAVSGAINWFFKNVEEGIVLEDDCLPNPSFFVFCEEMLEMYKDDENVMHISGSSFLPDILISGDSYYFSKYPLVWGWASWRRAWAKYSVSLKDWKQDINPQIFQNLGKIEKLYWANNFELVRRGILNTWDYQWVYTLFKNEGIAVNSEQNMIENIGFRENATHTTNSMSILIRYGVSVSKPRIIKIHKKPMVEINSVNDKYLSKKIFFINVFMIFYQFLKISRIIKVR